MKNKFLFALFAGGLIQCAPREDRNPDAHVDVGEYRKVLDTLRVEESSNLLAMEIFEDGVDVGNASRSDSSFFVFLQFQDSLVGQLNDRLFRQANYDKINSLAWTDTSAHLPEAKAYKKFLIENGLQLAASEGMVFIKRHMAPLADCFYPHLTDAGQDFFTQFAHESDHPFSEDAALIVSVKSLADRIAFWEAFVQNHPRHIFTPYAQHQAEKYKYFFLVGLNNTPAFDYELKKIDREFLNAYLYFVKKYPDSRSAPTIKDYLELLEKNDFTKNEAIDKFIEPHKFR